MRHTNFDNVVALFEGQATIPAAAPKGPAPAAVPSERRPNRPKRKDAETGAIVPADCYDYVVATPKRAGHWRVNARRLAEWRASLAPAAAPAETPAPIVEVESDGIDELTPGTAWRVIRGVATAWAVIQLGIVALGASYFAGSVLGCALALLIVGTSWALGLPGVSRLAHKAGAGAAMLLLHALIALAIADAGFVAYFMHQAPNDDATLLARQAHGEFQAEVWKPVVDEVETLKGKVSGIEYRHQAECGRLKCGPKAELIEAEQAVAMTALAAAEARRDALAPFFTTVPETAAAIHANDVAAAGVAGRTAPPRAAYVEPDLLRPYFRLASADAFALLSFALAAMFDGVGIVLQLVQHIILHRRRH